MDIRQQTIEVDKNFDYFQRNLAQFLQDHKGTYALIKSAQVVGFYESPGEAYSMGTHKFNDQIFSIQEVTDEPIDLGFFSHAGH